MAKRTMWTDAQKRRMVRYMAQHGFQATIEKYGVVGSCLSRWKRELSGEPTRSERRTNGARHTKVLLEEAWKLIQVDIGAGAPVRDSDLYVKLALNSLGGRK